MKIKYEYFLPLLMGIIIGYALKHFSTDPSQELKKAIAIKNEAINLKNEILILKKSLEKKTKQ